MNTKKSLFIPRQLTVVLLVLSLFLSGCSYPFQSQTQAREAFEELSSDIFMTSVTSDSLTLNYTLAHPEDYGISDVPVTLGRFSLSDMKKNLERAEGYRERLEQIRRSALTEEQKLTYDILKDAYDVSSSEEDFFLYYEVLSPSVGMQAQLPILLAEYHFYEKRDIDTYLELLPMVYDYFQDILVFEKEKSAAGLFMCDRAVDDIVAQCRDFIKEPEKNVLITYFNEKTDAQEGLSEKERTAYKKKNKELVMTKIIPAYEQLANGLISLKGTGKYEGGLCNYPDGKAYYKKLLESETGSSWSPQQMKKKMDDAITGSFRTIAACYQENPDILEECGDVTYPLSEPDEILSYLESAIQTDFPAMDQVNYTVKYVPKELQDFLSPAFYLTPAIDLTTENNIYINKGKNNNLDAIFTTLAHEGYPGHLYQNVYFQQQNPAPVRYVINYEGYSEGWATYVEMQSYHMAGFPEDVATVLEADQTATLCLHGRIDLGVNYYGWSLQDVADYLEDFGITDDEAAEQMYYTMIEEPGNYMKYVIGYLEFKELRDSAEKKLGDSFEAQAFHNVILKTGPSSFDILKTRVSDWIKKQ